MKKYFYLFALSMLAMCRYESFAMHDGGMKSPQDDSRLKQIIYNVVQNSFNPFNTAYAMKLSIEGEKVDYQYFPLSADHMYGAYIPQIIYGDFYNLLSSVYTNENHAAYLFHHLADWNASFYDQTGASDIMNIRLDHQNQKNLAIFFGKYPTSHSLDDGVIVRRDYASKDRLGSIK